jgi:CHAD domain-containing protein
MTPADKQERGLQYWMERVIDEAAKVRSGFEADPVHDLRVAIRRCRSIGDGFRMIDAEPAWKKMRAAGKELFAPLGDLRDVQVQMEWIQKLGVEGDPVRERVTTYFHERELELKAVVATALDKFDAKQWKQWATLLGERAEQLPVGGEVFQVIALERWIDACRLHTSAMRSRGKAALHATRIGLKKFRYIVENFLPELHEAWMKDLKHMQDLLGEVHDLDVLAETATRIRAFENPQQLSAWRLNLQGERVKRVDEYRLQMKGPDSLWNRWRSGLPDGEQLRTAILKKFELWSSLRDPDRLHTEAVLRTSLDLFDFLLQEKLLTAKDVEGVSQRDLLTVAVWGHEAGRGVKGKHHKQVVKLFEKLDVPPGWSPLHLRIAGLVARYHTGAPPNGTHKDYASLRKAERDMVDRLAGIIRFADGLERERDGVVGDFNVRRNNGNIEVNATGIKPRTRAAERVAAARHLLESVCGVPIVMTVA